VTEHPAVRVDAHHHVWDLAVRDQPWTADLPSLHRTFHFEELRPQLAQAGVTATVLVQTVTVAQETPELLELADRTSEIAGVVGWVDLTAPDVAEHLAALRSAPAGRWLVGVRHQVQAEPDLEWLLRSDVLRGLHAVADAGLSYDLLVTAPQLPAAVRVVRQLPELQFVLDHGGNPPIATGEIMPWTQEITELALLPNVAVKLSGLFTETAPDWTVDLVRPYAEHLMSSFGAQRTMFGSDWPVCTLRADYAEVVRVTEALLAPCTDAEARAIFGATAASWYRLDGRP
jgi:L-fuconolactonase